MTAPETPLTRDSGLVQEVPARVMRRRDVDRAYQTRRRLLLGIKPEPTASFIGTIEPPSDDKVGICCSGGGIRSASFNLGALQALSKEKSKEDPSLNRLSEAAYVAAVSGGSYIAAGMAMVAKTWDPAEPQPKKGEPGYDDSDPSLIAETPPFHPGSPEEQYLRNRSSYLAPGASGKLALGYRVILGFVFNLGFLTLVLAPTGFFLGLAYRWRFPTLRTPVTSTGTACKRGDDNCVFTASLPHWLVMLLVWALVAFALLGIWTVIWRFKHDSWRAAVQAWSLRFIVTLGVATVFIALVPATLAALRNLSDHPTTTAVTSEQVQAVGTVGGASLATVLLGVFLQLQSRISEPATALESISTLRRWFGKLSSGLSRFITYFAGAIAGPLLLLAIIVWTALLTVKEPEISPRDWVLVAISLSLFVLLYYRADLTTWSLHPFYRRRLASAFALKRVKDERMPAMDLTKKAPEVARERDYTKLVALSQTGLESWPTLLVCAAANISNPAPRHPVAA